MNSHPWIPVVRAWGLRLGAGALVFLSGCSEDGPIAASCDGTVMVSVQPGTSETWTIAPTFSWSPACQVESVAVSDAGSGNVRWFATTAGRSNGIAPPVVYASQPDGAVSTGTPVFPLIAGGTYRVVVSRLVGTDPVSHPVGEAVFVP